MKNKKRILTGLVTAVMTAALVLSPVTAGAVTQSDIDNLKNQSDSISSQISDVQAELDRLADAKEQTLAEKALYDEQCALITQQIQLTESQISDYEELIAQSQKEYDEAVAAEKAQEATMKERVRAMEERGPISYWEILFGASSFSDLLSRIDFIQEIISSDEKVIADYQAAQQDTLNRQAQLTELKSASETAKEELVASQNELEGKRAQAEALVAEIQSNAAQQQAYMDELEAEDENIKNQITAAEAEYEEQIKRQQEQQSGGSSGGSSGSGGYVGGGGSGSINGIDLIWPVSSRKINSYFGGRESPGGIGSTNHKGIDIGGVEYTTPVGAAAAGVVTISMYSSSAGNYVAVSHGNGVTTVYMHLSSRSVSVGETVYQGQQLGITGSTGNSTGPHLHFGITLYGTYVDPLDYLSW